MKLITEFFKPVSLNFSFPTVLIKCDKEFVSDDTFVSSTVYFVNINGEANISFNNTRIQDSGELAASFPINPGTLLKISSTGKFYIFVRKNYLGQFAVSSPEKIGRLSYIDGCTDSILIYPPRLGDSSLNLLHFPKKTIQSFHTHPSIRAGVILSGSGFADLNSEKISLNAGDFFYIEPNESHRFVTDQEEMRLIAFHPDGDFGPTDSNHIMINRTYLNNR